MSAAGPGHAMGQQAAPCCEGNFVVGIVEQREVEPRFAQELCRIRAQAPKDIRKRERGANAHHRFGGPASRRSLSGAT